MNAHALAPTVSGMSGDEGARIRERRTRIGIGVKGLAERAGVDRGRLTEIEKGAPARDSTIGALERALSELEHEMGLDLPLPPGVTPIGEAGQGLVEFSIEGAFGVRAIVKGPVADIEALQKAVAELIASMNRPETDTTP